MNAFTRWLVVLMGAMLPAWLCAQIAKTLYIGNDSILIIKHIQSYNGLVYFSMHDDENTSVEAALAMLPHTNGCLVELRHFGDLADNARHISFLHQQKIYTFDPNRIFTDSDSVRAETLLDRRGLVQAAHHLKKIANKARIPTEAECYEVARTVLKSFADSILYELDTFNINLLVALHNNHSYPAHCEHDKVVPESYNLASYLRPNSHDNLSCSDIYINPRHALSDFVVVTDFCHFEEAFAHRCNAVLQHHNPPDDGSLSVWAARQHIGYINVEAKRGNLTEQLFLLELIPRLLRK